MDTTSLHGHQASLLRQHETVPAEGTATPSRITALDFLRGLIMIVMALDHTRDFFHRAFTADPTDMATTTPALFFTRFITHFCAPVFVFLAGTSAWMQGRRKTRRELSAFLVKRGLWLILFEVLVMSFALSFDPGYPIVFLLTLWAIGASMVVLGGAIRLPFKAILATGLLIVLGHNALDFYEAAHPGPFPLPYSALHRPWVGPVAPGHLLVLGYPFLPWTGLMLLGYCFGKLYTGLDPARRRRTILRTGVGLLLFFAVLRGINLYGDPRPWSEQASTLFTVMSFFNVTKYPPSLLFQCVTIGGALLLLALRGERNGPVTRIVSVYGRVPFFYYAVHFFVLHLFAVLLFGSERQATEGFGLPGVYAVWLGTVILLYPLCRWYDRYKRTHQHWWLSYL
ncbi:MAG: DUF1624 domain-containing protein [Chitinophagaceae bacterium]|nr:MAG: DUF1624 domain-containing protein [Chitinophagaceae bacterium]